MPLEPDLLNKSVFFVKSRGLSLISGFLMMSLPVASFSCLAERNQSPKTRSQTSRNTRTVKLVTWYKIRPSDWSIQKILQSDWLVRIPPPYTTDLVAWPVQREGCREEFQKKKFNEAEEIASVNMGARNQYSSINFLGGFMEGISQIFIANVRDFYSVAFASGER